MIEEDIHARLASALAFAASVLEQIDHTQRLTHVAIAATLNASDAIVGGPAGNRRQSPAASASACSTTSVSRFT
ncbi:MAG: hypothetical protein ACK4P4_02615 [Allorhizobium sp.]